ncbi:SDR family oxidoreductase [Bellilinea sp.]|uniref:SDR family oxidoreductase n=1 Tax=Bellilinea sp. TaxID=2838785 RepID=UPI002ADD7F9D|nr:SDR family oxidoreductase [Bellilinea sp.]
MTWTVDRKKVLITGGTDGIGKVTALELANRGAHVIIIGRNPQKTEQTVREIREQSDNPRVDFLIADLSEQEQVRRVAAEYRHRYDQLHVLINNAGAFFAKRELTADGLEKTFALNHLAYFLLTHLLLDLLTKSAPARIINVSSAAHFGGKINFDDLNAEKSYSGWGAYSNSKLMNVLFTYELARRLQGSGVTVNCLHPGFVATQFGKNNGGLIGLGLSLVQRVGAISPEQGAETTLYLATSPEVEGITGRYFDQKKAVESSKISQDEETARRLWEVSLELTGLKEKTA